MRVADFCIKWIILEYATVGLFGGIGSSISLCSWVLKLKTRMRILLLGRNRVGLYIHFHYVSSSHIMVTFPVRNHAKGLVEQYLTSWNRPPKGSVWVLKCSLQVGRSIFLIHRLSLCKQARTIFSIPRIG